MARVALFVTCLVDLFRPSVGFAAAQLIERAGYKVEVPAQGCCGQPNFNGGDKPGARAIAQKVIDAFAAFEYVVAPSGSCAAMIKVDYPALFEPEDRAPALDLAGRTFELTQFLVDVAGLTMPPAQNRIAYHDSCSGLRRLGIAQSPRALLGLDTPVTEECCGFGGLFSAKYPAIAGQIADAKCRALLAQNPQTIVGGDLGCLLHIEQRLRALGQPTPCQHIAEVLVKA
jgi:L-lactate dehydrogenase complex protein LldE